MKRDQLVEFRKDKGWSQKKVVQELESKYSIKITGSYYGMIEQGVRSPSLKLALAIANLYNTRPEKIFLTSNTTKSCEESTEQVI